MTIAPDTDVYYDPYHIDIVNDPYPVYARLREEAPVYYNERYDFWAISRYADVEKALSDWETFSNSRGDILELVQSDFDMPKGVMMMEDPPVHTMLRGLMSRVFTPRRMAEIEDQIQMARRYYNGAVRNLNISIQSFPDVIVARILGFREEPFFELESRAEAAAPQIGFPGAKA